MILLNYYWQFEGALSKQLCKRIIKLGLSKKVKKSETGEFSKNKLKSLEKRDSSVAWLDNSWIYTNKALYRITALKISTWLNRSSTL